MQPPTEAVTLEPIVAKQAHILRRLFPLYCHDLSAYGDTWRLDHAGIWQPEYILPYWLAGHPGTHPLLIRYHNQPAGFVLVGAAPFPYKNAETDYRLCEFFVVRYFRRQGIAANAVGQVLARFSGSWELVVLPANTGARIFWQKCLAHIKVPAVESTSDEGCCFRFTVRP